MSDHPDTLPPGDFPVPGKYIGIDLDVIGRLHLWQAADPAELLDCPKYIKQFEDCNELMPYWSDLWPSSRALARRLIEEWGHFAGVGKALEIGAGLGVAGLTLAKLGMATTLTDFADDALIILAIHLRENGLAESAMNTVAKLDYFNPQAFPGGPFDLIIGSDILFEVRNCQPLAHSISLLLAPGGRAMIADPFRSTADSFADCLSKEGLSVDETVLAPKRAGPPPFSGIRLFEVMSG